MRGQIESFTLSSCCSHTSLRYSNADILQVKAFLRGPNETFTLSGCFSVVSPKYSTSGVLQVQAFLRGPGETFTLSGCFSGIADARKAVCELLGKSSRYGYGSSFGQGSCIKSSYSISAEARGTGRNAHVVIRKTQAWHQAQMKHKEGHQQELQAVSQLLRKPAAAAAAAAAAAVPADVRPVADSGVDVVDLTSD